MNRFPASPSEALRLPDFPAFTKPENRSAFVRDALFLQSAVERGETDRDTVLRAQFLASVAAHRARAVGQRCAVSNNGSILFWWENETYRAEIDVETGSDTAALLFRNKKTGNRFWLPEWQDEQEREFNAFVHLLRAFDPTPCLEENE